MADEATTKAASKRLHKATYASNKREGGYLIRVQGPTAGAFASREVPVTRRDGTESTEKLTSLIWTGIDDETGEKVALYHFEARPRDEVVDDLPF
jgi:hypothetical protein